MKSERRIHHPARHRRWATSAPQIRRGLPAAGFDLVNPNLARYMNSISGSDLTGDGTISNPYQTLAKCRNSISNQSASNIYTVCILNAGVISEPPISNWAPFINIAGPGWLECAVNTPITVIPVNGEQGWLEIEGISLGGDNGSGYAFVYDGTAASLATLKLFDTFVAGLLFRNDADNQGYLQTNCGILGFKTTLRGNAIIRGTDIEQVWEVEESQSGGSFVEIIGSAMELSDVTIHGNSTVILAGCTPPKSITGGITITPGGSTVPTLQVDPGSGPDPTTLGLPLNLKLAGDLFYVKYTPGTPGQWAGSPPTNASAALDRLAAAVFALGGNTPIP